MSPLPFPLSNKLVPEHYLLNERETQKVLQQYNIDRYQLPKIFSTDPTIRHLPVRMGDVIKIIRKSPTAGEAIYYRVVISHDKKIIPPTFQDTSFIDLFNRGIKHDTASDEQICKELWQNFLALVAPHRGLDRIIVGREKEVNWFYENILRNENSSFNLLEGEIGAGKTFLLNYLREQAWKKNYTVSKIEILKDRTLADSLYFQIINNITLPEQPLVVGRLELIFKKLLFNLYITSCKELSNMELESSDIPRLKLMMINKVNQFISEVDEFDNRVAEDVGYFFDAAIMNSDFSSDFRLHEKTRNSHGLRSIYAFAQLVQYAGYKGLMILIDEMEQDRNINSYNVIYSLQENCPSKGLKIVIAGTSDLMEEKSSGIRVLKKELYDLLEKSKISIVPLSLSDKKKLAIKIVDVLRVADAIEDIDYSLINSKMDKYFASNKMKSTSTTRDFIMNFINYIEEELSII